MKKFSAFLVILLLTITVFSQNADYTREVVTRLCSPEFFGRGYVDKGDSLAADFIAAELKGNKVKAFGNSYFQRFHMPINSQTRADIWFDGEKMSPDGSWLIEASAPPMSGSYPVIQVDASALKHSGQLIRSTVTDPNAFYLLDSTGLDNPELYQFAKNLIMSPVIPNAGLIEVVHRAPFGVVRKHFDPFVKIQIHQESTPESVSEIRVENETVFVEQYLTQNVIGQIKGKTDDWIVFTAHYDGEGMYGDVLFPAGNDNASGTGMVLDLARHYAKGKKPHYNMAFMLVSGEEAGLLGSTHYVNHPLFPLDNIRMVINLDMVASGEDGVMLFNATTWPLEHELLNQINEKNQYMPAINPRGPAANSDHHPFHAKGVPAVFFITQGEAPPAHTAYDLADRLLWPKYNELFSLVTGFVDQLPNLPEPIRYPLVDYHIHLKGDMTREKAIELSEKSGITYGVAVNCGVGFPVHSDEAALQWLAEMKDNPFLLGMQAEGREWVHTFSPNVIQQFDYVFTDAMTYFDANGKRVRLWINEEVDIPDPEAFMDELTKNIVEIVTTEPIDIYVNSTFLPECIADQYDTLWTPERMDQVIEALVTSGIAMEINNRYRIPSADFITRAKAAGVKFTFGTNNTDSQTGNLDYCREMIAKCRLVADDLKFLHDR